MVFINKLHLLSKENRLKPLVVLDSGLIHQRRLNDAFLLFWLTFDSLAHTLPEFIFIEIYCQYFVGICQLNKMTLKWSEVIC